MRYIRTENTVYERYDDKIKAVDGYIAVKPKGLLPIKGYQIVSKDRILKESDYILDLCEGIIVEEIGNGSIWFVMGIDEFKNGDKEELKYLMKSWRYNFFIKNDRGLIYVAKMNNKGELELL